jgi:hypothetical protein
MSESFHDLSYICLFILGIQDLCRNLLSQSSPKISSLSWMCNMRSMTSNLFKSNSSRWTKWDGVIEPFHVPSEQFDLNPVLDSKFVLRMMSYLMLSLSKTNTIKRFDAPVLSNSGYLKSCIVTTLCILR